MIMRLPMIAPLLANSLYQDVLTVMFGSVPKTRIPRIHIRSEGKGVCCPEYNAKV
jgi:hypothetical protein